MYEIGQMVTDYERVGIIINICPNFVRCFDIKWAGYDKLEACSIETVKLFVRRWNDICEEACG